MSKFVLLVLFGFVFAQNSECFFFRPLLNIFASSLANGTALFANGTLFNNTIFDLVSEHIAHSVGSLASFAELAELLAAQKLLRADFAAEYATNVSEALAAAFRNYTEAKINVTNEASQTAVNASTALLGLGAEAAALKPSLGAGVVEAFAG